MFDYYGLDDKFLGFNAKLTDIYKKVTYIEK